MILVVLIGSHIVLFCLGWWLCSKATQSYIRSEIMEQKTPFTGEELERLKKFVMYEKKNEYEQQQEDDVERSIIRELTALLSVPVMEGSMPGRRTTWAEQKAEVACDLLHTLKEWRMKRAQTMKG